MIYVFLSITINCLNNLIAHVCHCHKVTPIENDLINSFAGYAKKLELLNIITKHNR